MDVPVTISIAEAGMAGSVGASFIAYLIWSAKELRADVRKWQERCFQMQKESLNTDAENMRVLNRALDVLERGGISA